MSSTTAGSIIRARPSRRRTRPAGPRWRTRHPRHHRFKRPTAHEVGDGQGRPRDGKAAGNEMSLPERTIGNSSRSDYDLSCLAPRDQKCWAQNGTHDNNRTLKARSPDAPSAKGLVAFRNEAEATRQPPPKLPWEAICAHEASILQLGHRASPTSGRSGPAAPASCGCRAWRRCASSGSAWCSRK